MPPRKPKHLQKTKAESTAEDYFPIDEKTIRRSIAKENKILEPEDLEKIEILAIKPKKRKKSSKITLKKGKKGKISDFSPEKISLKKDGYELIITEKPQAALKISSALGRPVKKNYQNIPYYELERNGKKIIVACAVGHLFTLKQTSGSGFPVFDVKWVPNFMARKQDFTKKYYETLSRLSQGAGSLTIATDYDTEGEVIGLNIMRFICGQSDAKRMKFSTLTDKELEKAYEQKSATINWGQAIAGETRHYLDWFYGINLSRALMNAIKSVGAFRIMSIGRVQGPALNMIVEKEKEIRNFKSQKYWQVFATVKNSHETELKHNKDIFNEKEIEKFKSLVGKSAIAKTEKKEQLLPPNPPFDLTMLQMESYRVYGIAPARTLQIAQSLYLNGLISYPRTSSQKLPDSIAYEEILSVLSKRYNAINLIKRQKPVEGKKSDPAHPSIYPTGQIAGGLSGEEEKIYNLIARRFLSLFCEDAIIDKKTISIDVDMLKFSDSGSSVRKKAWLEIYPVKIIEKEISDLNGKVTIKKIRTEEKETQPPKRYTQASIISELEKRNLGTKATRANILETLYDRNYVSGKSIEATSLGISLIETLQKNSPIIIDEKLTRNLEGEMESISESKKDFLQKEEKVIEKAKEAIIKISNEFNERKEDIGKELLKANVDLMEKLREENKLNECPICKKGNLIINYSKKTRRYFIACNAYPNCKTTYSLPPNGLVKKANKNCESCGFAMVLIIRKAKRLWILCFNPSCEKNIERMEEYRKKKESEKLTEEKSEY